VVVAAAWISVIGSAVTAIAAFGGVLLAQRATRMRDLEGRIWEHRSGVYEYLMRWVLVIDHAVDDQPEAHGKAEKAPRLAFRISDAGAVARIALLPSPRRWHAWRRYRRLDQDDDVLLALHDITRDAS
jgi:hypothetical protein